MEHKEHENLTQANTLNSGFVSDFIKLMPSKFNYTSQESSAIEHHTPRCLLKKISLQNKPKQFSV